MSSPGSGHRSPGTGPRPPGIRTFRAELGTSARFELAGGSHPEFSNGVPSNL